MASFNHIGGAEPSTLTFKLATVTQTRNSSVMHQEIMALGDPDSSAAIAAVLNTVPASTAWALAVRQVGNSSIQGNSTVFQGTSPWVISGNSSVAQASSNWQVQVTNQARVTNSSAADFLVQVSGNSTAVIQGNSTVIQGTSPWIIAGNSSVAQASTVWAVQMSQYSTIAAVSSVGGVVTVTGNCTVAPIAGSTWRTQPGSTLWASSAGFHFDSSGALQIAGSITATAGSTVSTGFIAVRISDGSTWVVDYLNASTFVSTAVGGGVNFLRTGASSVSSSDLFVIPWGSTQGAQYFIPVTDSGVSVMDSTNTAIKVNVVAGSAASTTVNVSSVGGRVGMMPFSTSWASSAGFHFDSSGFLNVAASFTGSTGPLTVSQLLDSSGGSVAVGDSANSALRVNVVAGAAGGSTIVTVSTGSVRVHQSTASDLQATVAQASTVWAVQLTQYSTTVNVSSLGGAVIVRSSAANLLAGVYQSTAADLQATVTQASTTWAVQLTQWSTTHNVSSVGGVVTIAGNSTVSIGTNLQSSVMPSSGSSGLVVRQVIDAIATFASTSALASTTVSVVSSAASIRAYVTAYSITSTNQTAAHWGFFSSNATLLWPITLAALSSGVAGANLAVAAPGYLFRTAASEALNFKTAGSTVAGVQMGVSYFLAP